ncbi:chemotaxis protein CheW, partial [Pseudomonas aeruginosa]|nr:chemotaxis protein CheW [Pseudomonas aeruginosa]
MSQTVATQNSAASLTGLLVPLADRTLLLPNVAVAELIPYRAPPTSDGAPGWVRGPIAWRE